MGLGPALEAQQPVEALQAGGRVLGRTVLTGPHPLVALHVL